MRVSLRRTALALVLTHKATQAPALEAAREFAATLFSILLTAGAGVTTRSCRRTADFHVEYRLADFDSRPAHGSRGDPYYDTAHPNRDGVHLRKQHCPHVRLLGAGHAWAQTAAGQRFGG